MTNDEYPVYDFASAGSVSRPLAVAVDEWINKFATLFVERWSDFSVAEISASRIPVTAKTFGASQKSWRVPCFGMSATIESNGMTVFFAVERIELLALLLEILGGGTPEDIVDRELTSVEQSLSQLLFEYSTSILSEAWPRKNPLPITCNELDTNCGRSRVFDSEDEMVVAVVTIKSSVGNSKIHLLFPKPALEQLLGVETDPAKNNVGGLQNVPIENITNIAVTVSAKLGTTMMDMADLTSISEGDIVMLDQQIVAPIVLSVNDQPMFQAWPGKIGKKQGLQVDSFVNK